MRLSDHFNVATLTVATLFFTLSFSANLSAAANDFSKIKRDINVMTQVIKGTFENAEECADCKIKIESKYLASQGAVFTISPTRGFSFIFNDQDFSFRIPEFPDEPDHPDMEFVTDDDEMSGIVEGIVEGVELSLSGLSNAISGDQFEAHAFAYSTDSSTRDALRELRRSERELQNEIRDYEIELIHADDEERIKQIDAEIARLDAKVDATILKKEKLGEEIEKERHIIIRQREEKREKKQQLEKMRFKQVEKIALSAFCDYGSMLKNLPSREHISIIFAGGKREGKSDQIYVLEKSDLNNCSSREDLAEKAIKYEF